MKCRLEGESKVIIYVTEWNMNTFIGYFHLQKTCMLLIFAGIYLRQLYQSKK